MARIIKGKKTIDREATAIPGTKTRWTTEGARPGFVKSSGDVYTLTIGALEVELTEAEMFNATVVWLGAMRQNRVKSDTLERHP